MAYIIHAPFGLDRALGSALYAGREQFAQDSIKLLA
jgi:hypothetical protein